ncbi:hypothetical protein ACFPH6_24190 [Streptomyces xiangluensis]|uniref:Uncharacterized protein n=1 Tax=Streptomyces xiangluensis TaxID=2665720 RepID=A0ABV8YTK0_9ACTN
MYGGLPAVVGSGMVDDPAGRSRTGTVIDVVVLAAQEAGVIAEPAA